MDASQTKGSSNHAPRSAAQRDSPPTDISASRRETGILAAGVTAIPLLVASGITVLPQLHGVWPTAAGAAVVFVIIVVVGVQIVRSARRLLLGQAVDTEVVAYTDNRQTGILEKGKIQNVALRVSTIHRIVDSLTNSISLAERQEALYHCGQQVGKSWVSDFHKELPKLEIPQDDISQQLLKWSEYDATAGMGRLSIAVDPDTGEGLVVLANSFLSRTESAFPLNWWFAGYLAGSLSKLLNVSVHAEMMNPTPGISLTTLFAVRPTIGAPPTPPPGRPSHRHSVARGPVYLKRLKTPLSNETV
jgi:hypothetical protein